MGKIDQITLLKSKRLLLIFSVSVLLIIVPIFISSTKKIGKVEGWYDDRWQFRKAIVIDADKVAGDLDNFPILINHTDTDLISTTQTDGDDIIFTDNNFNLLDFELEKFTQETGAVVAWVNVPKLLSSEDTTIYMYYGNPAASNQENASGVWDSNYVAVYHFAESAGNYLDSTSNNNDSSAIDVASRTGTGIAGDAPDFNNTSNDEIEIPTSASLELTGTTYTVEAWINADVVNTKDLFLCKEEDSNGYSPYCMGFEFNPSKALIYSYDSSTNYYQQNGNTTITSGSYFYVAGVLDGTGNQLKVYLDGTDDSAGGESSFANTLYDTPNNLFVGRGEGNNYYDGRVDEVRISDIARSDQWLLTTENTVGSPSTFYSRGQEEVSKAPVGHWKFNENGDNTCIGGANDICDTSDSRNDGAMTGGTWQSVNQCVEGACMFFDGSDDVATITNSAEIDFDTGLSKSVTFSTWIKVNSDGESNQGEIFDKGTNTYIRVTNEDTDGYADLETSLSLSSTSATKIITNGIMLNRWHHVAMAYTDDSDDEITIYIDGVSKGSSTNGSGAPSADTNNLLIGGSTSNNFHGFIDDFKIYAYERTANEIKLDYNRGLSEGSAAYLGPDNSWLSDGLVGYWKMDDAGIDLEGETISDSSGNGNSGTLYGDNGVGDNGTGMDCTVAGKFGTNCDTDGTDDYISFSDLSVIDNSNTSLTISMWIKPDDVSTTQMLASKYDPGAGNREFQLYLSNTSKIGWNVQETNTYDSNTDYKGNLTLSTGNWYFITVVFESGKRQDIFINGSLDATLTPGVSVPVDFTDTSEVFRLSSDANSGTIRNFYNGLMDEVRVYNRALSPAEVSRLYSWAPGPYAYWPLDEGAGTAAYDISGNDIQTSWNDSPSWTNGKFGNALSFRGDDGGYIYRDSLISTDAKMDNLPNIDMTVSLWMYWRDNGEAIADIPIGVRNTNKGWYVQLHEGFQRAAFITECGTQDGRYDSADNTIPYNTWVHIAATWDAATTKVKWYINGIETASYATTDACTGGYNDDTSADFYIGKDNQIGQLFPGYLDEIKIYRYKRSQAEIVQDMNGGHPAPGSPVGSYVAYWKMDESSGTTAYDQSTNKNDLTLNSASGTLDGKNYAAWNGTGATWLSRGADDNDFDFDSTDDMTVTMWFKSDSASNPSGIEYLMDKRSASAGYSIYTDSSGDIIFGIDDDSTWGPEDAAGDGLTLDYYDGTWHHLAAVKSGNSSISMYIDGKLTETDASLTANGSLANSATLYIGDSDATNNGDEFNGDIDDVKIYRSALTAGQILVDMNQGKATVFGALSTDGTGPASNSASDAFCVPGSSDYCAAPVGYWMMDENTGTTANDSSGNGNSGTLTSGPVWNQGVLGSSVAFDGTDDYIVTNDSAPITQIFNGGGTITAWIKPKSFGEGTLGRIIDDGGTSTSNGWALAVCNDGNSSHCNNQSLLLYNNSNGGTDGWFSSNANSITTNTWTHVAVTFDNSSVSNTPTFYINGIQMTTTTNTTPTVGFEYGDNENLLIGNRENGDRAFDGSIDNVRLYNYARTPAQIAWDYNRGKPIAHWKMDETSWNGTADEAKDTSGNNLHATSASGANTTSSGKFNYAGTFDGTDDHLDFSDSDLLSFGNSTTDKPFSITAWINPNDATSFGIISKGSTTAPEYFFKMDSSGLLELDLYDNSTSAVKGRETTADLTGYESSWVHVAATYDGTSGTTGIKLYVNGVEQDTDSVIIGSYTAMHNQAQAGAIGRYLNDGAGYYANGKVDDVRIYNYELTANQIKSILNIGAATF